MSNHRQGRLLFGMSAALFAGALLLAVNGPASLEQSAQAAGPVPFDAAGQRSAMVDELRAIKELLNKAETRAAKAEKDRAEFEEAMNRRVDEHHRELIKLLQSGRIKVDSVVQTTAAVPN